MKIKSIHNIELSSLCTRSCKYCPCSVQADYRLVGNMSWDIFKECIKWAKTFIEKGTQTEINLYGVGEAFLNPNAIEMIGYARQELPLRQHLHINTNGKLITQKIAYDILDAGLTDIHVTMHNLEHTAIAIDFFKNAGIPTGVSADPYTNPNNWAGQVDWFEPTQRMGECPWLNNGYVMVHSDGKIVTCPLDAFQKSKTVNIFDDITKHELLPFELCKKCHHDLPSSTIIL